VIEVPWEEPGPICERSSVVLQFCRPVRQRHSRHPNLTGQKEVPLESSALARRIVDLLVEKKATDTLLLDIREISLLADYFVITTGEVDRQIEAMVEELSETLKHEGRVIPLRVEGEASSGWVLMDYGSVVVHLFSPAMRDYYRLEDLWKNARVLVRIQ